MNNEYELIYWFCAARLYLQTRDVSPVDRLVHVYQKFTIHKMMEYKEDLLVVMLLI